MFQSEAKLLEKTYRDSLTVTRKTMYVDEKGESRYRDDVIYKNKKCGVSKGNSPNKASDKEEFYSRSDNEKVIFTTPDIEMQLNDQAIVITEIGQILKGKTGKTFLYTSHGETELRIEELA